MSVNVITRSDPCRSIADDLGVFADRCAFGDIVCRNLMAGRDQSGCFYILNGATGFEGTGCCDNIVTRV